MQVVRRHIYSPSMQINTFEQSLCLVAQRNGPPSFWPPPPSPTFHAATRKAEAQLDAAAAIQMVFFQKFLTSDTVLCCSHVSLRTEA